MNITFCPSRSFKVTDFRANAKPIYDFLLVNNSNICSNSHRFRDIADFYSAAIAEQCKRCISYSNSVRLSVCLSVCHTLVPYLDE